PRDQAERTGQTGARDAPTTMPLADEVAGDPPVGRARATLLVLPAALDPRHLVRCAELAPADAVVAVEHEGGVRGALLHAFALPLAVQLGRRLLVGTFGVEADAPAAAEHTVVPFDERRERIPRALVQRP